MSEPQISFTDYALMRMRQRDILEEEVVETLRSRRAQHQQRKDGRWEVRYRVRRRLLVVYLRRPSDWSVINAMWE
jgi:hypothetical protein